MERLQKDFVLCCDVGTSYMKIALIDKNGNVQAMNRTRVPKSPLLWCESFCTCSKLCLDLCFDVVPQIRAICVSGNGPTVITTDGKAVFWNDDTSDFVFCDQRAFFMPKLMALEQWQKESYQKSDFIFGTPEYLIYNLCGAKVNIVPSPRFAVFYQGMQRNAVPFGFVAGELKSQIAKDLGLENIPKVICGCPDFLVAMIGTNCLEAGKLCNRAGTSEAFNLATPIQVQGKGLRTMPGIIDGVWNVSAMIEESSTMKKQDKNLLLEKIKNGVEALKGSVQNAGLPNDFFPQKTVVTGGQACDKDFLFQKARKTGLCFVIPSCLDCELLGLAIIAWTALGEYDNIQSAAKNMFCAEEEISA